MEKGRYSSELLIKSPLLKFIQKDWLKYQIYNYLDKNKNLDQYMLINNNQLDTLWLNAYTNIELRNINEFVNRSIVLKFGSISEETFGVLLRIATGMLNKCKSINDAEKRKLHCSLCLRLKLEFNSVFNEMLPF